MSFGENIYSHCQKTRRKELYMEIVTIFRVERKGIGPYQARSDISDDWEEFQCHLGESHSGNHHPTWARDNFDYSPQHLAGFISMADLKIWFGEFLIPLLHNFDFEVVQYEVPIENIQEGEGQVCFLPEERFAA